MQPSHGEITLSLNRILSTEAPFFSASSSATFNNNSVLPSFLGLPKIPTIFMGASSKEFAP
jgi:hypothetical protein